MKIETKIMKSILFSSFKLFAVDVKQYMLLAPIQTTYATSSNPKVIKSLPLHSVLGMNERSASMYVVGIYGNTMTTNPRALETAVAVLEQITPELRQNIRDRGKEFVDKLKLLAEELPGTITKVQGTGLLLSAELEPSKFPVVGFDAVEPWCRRRGLGVIHGGHNALRFTPHFRITSQEIDLIIDIVRDALVAFS